MAKRLQHRGGTTVEHSTFTGAVREVTVDTDKNTLVVHDGATAGGFPLAKYSDLSNLSASNLTSGTVNTSRLPTIPTTKGGTGLTALGSAGQALVVNSGGTALEYGDVSVDLSSVAQSVIPSTTDTYDLGSSSKVWRNIYTGDLHLSNEAKDQGNSIDGTKGSWTIQEGQDDLYILNNKSGKKYKFKLEEI